jgi:dipeptidase E
MVMTPRIGDLFVEWPSAPDVRTLGLVDFAIFPHLDVFPTNTMGAAEAWAADIGGPAYVLDDQSAIRVVDGHVDVVSEGTWRRLRD